MTLVSDTFQQTSQPFTSRKDVFIHRIMIVHHPTDYSEAVANKEPLQVQIGGVSQATISDLCLDVPIVISEAIVDVVYTAAVNMIDGHVLKLWKKIEFQPSLRINIAKDLFIGAKSIFAGSFSIGILVSEKDIS